MKKIFYSLIAFALPLSVLAQPTIDSAEFYQVGQHFNYRYCTNVPPGPAGAMQTWDFTSVSDSSVAAVDVVAAAAPANVSMAIGGITYYLNVNDTQTVITGLDLPIASISYTPPAILITHPVTYLDVASDTFTNVVNVVSPPVTANGGGWSTMNADGYGTLKTPQGTFTDVLRVKSMHSEDDTSLAGVEHIDFVSYLWYDSLHVYPLMRIDSVIGIGALPLESATTSYYTTDTTTGVKSVNATQASAFAHFDNNGLVLKTDLVQGRQYNAVIFNLNGQVVYQTTFTASGSIERISAGSQLPTGTYMVWLAEANGRQQPLIVKVVKQ